MKVSTPKPLVKTIPQVFTIILFFPVIMLGFIYELIIISFMTGITVVKDFWEVI